MLLGSSRRVLAGCAFAISALSCSEPTIHSASPGRTESPASVSDEPLAGLPDPMPRSDSFRRGLAIGPLTAPEDERAETAFKRERTRQLDRARELGATDVQLVVRWRQAGEAATELFPFDSIHDDLLSWLIEQAHRRKLRVWLSPTLVVEDGAETRPARALAPKSWDSWWWSYRRMALHYARVAALRKVAMLSLGVDLASSEGQSDRWRKLIQDARKIYKGKLTYAASAERFDKVDFWDALDVLGVSVEQQHGGSEAQLLARLEPLTKRLAEARAARGLGYVVSDGGCGAAARDEARELLCQRALFRSFREEKQLQGVYVRDIGYDAAAEHQENASSGGEVVRHWYQKSKGS